VSTQQQALVTVTVDGRPLGVFDTRTGGDVTADVPKRRAGGQLALRSYGALPDYDDVTVSRVYERERDHELIRHLRTRVGRARCVVSEQPLDDYNAPWGKPVTYLGRLGPITTGEVDSDTGDVRMWELTVVVESVA
jgi:hypothetical protein